MNLSQNTSTATAEVLEKASSDLLFAEADQDFSHIDKQAVVTALKDALPAQMVLHTDEQLRPYECDGFMLMTHVPLAVVLPETEAQVVIAIQICSKLGVPIVARGAGTGLSGGALPHPYGVVLSLARLNRILKVDQYARTATVQPGVRNIQVSQAAEPYGLY